MESSRALRGFYLFFKLLDLEKFDFFVVKKMEVQFFVERHVIPAEEVLI